MEAPRAREVNADVLVIGGGIAGCFAAVKARASGLEVLLVEKGGIGRSGCTPWVTGMAVFSEEWGDERREWMEYCLRNGEYLVNRTWLEILIDGSRARHEELASWGMDFGDTSDGRPRRLAFPGSDTGYLLVYQGEENPQDVLRKKLAQCGVRTIERTMITDLLVQDGRVVGALGLPFGEREVIAIEARATVLCAGAASFKPSGFPAESLTADGDTMAYRVGAEITGKEFVDVHWTYIDEPAWGEFRRDEFMDSPHHARRFTPEGIEAPGPQGAAGAGRGESVTAGLAHHKAEGIWPGDDSGASTVAGLFAAGDALGSMQCGADYRSLIGLSFAGSAVQGARAGEAAARFAAQAAPARVTGEQVSRLTEALLAPAERNIGFAPAWATQVLQNAVTPYFVLYVKEKKRLEAALTTVEFLRDHVVPRLTAKDPHELRLARETENMVLNAEMKLKASLFRTESRGTHFREDYPARDDDRWLAWVKLKEVDGEMKLDREPLPDDWKPDLTVPYEERYPLRYPGELEYLRDSDILDPRLF
jgi:succinate dehydrogenase/fumarate reductase flavoprotein subunit